MEFTVKSIKILLAHVLLLYVAMYLLPYIFITVLCIITICYMCFLSVKLKINVCTYTYMNMFLENRLILLAHCCG